MIAQLQHITAPAETDERCRRNPADLTHHEILRQAHDRDRPTHANRMNRSGFQEHRHPRIEAFRSAEFAKKAFGPDHGPTFPIR